MQKRKKNVSRANYGSTVRQQQHRYLTSRISLTEHRYFVALQVPPGLGPGEWDQCDGTLTPIKSTRWCLEKSMISFNRSPTHFDFALKIGFKKSLRHSFQLRLRSLADVVVELRCLIRRFPSLLQSPEQRAAAKRSPVPEPQARMRYPQLNCSSLLSRAEQECDENRGCIIRFPRGDVSLSGVDAKFELPSRRDRQVDQLSVEATAIVVLHDATEMPSRQSIASNCLIREKPTANTGSHGSGEVCGGDASSAYQHLWTAVNVTV